nr:PREDICTED: long-chain fatty acid transport protein 4-like isoform X2 [Bemisia tabaci]
MIKLIKINSALQRYLRFLFSVRLFSRGDLTVADIFRRHVIKNPTKVIFIFEGKEWTAQEVEEYSNKVANVFKAQGFKKGDAVALMLENRPEFVCIWLGLSKIGVVTALINYNLRQNSLSHSVKISDASAFIFGEELLQDVLEVAETLNNVQLFSWNGSKESKIEKFGDGCLVNDIYSMIQDASPAIPTVTEKIGFHDKLLYIYTSGTTGLPKAAVITNARYLFLAGAIAYQVGFRNSDRFYTPLPLYHTAGGAMCVGQAVIYGATVVIRKKFSASQYFLDVVKYECTVGQYIGEMCRYMLSTPEKPEDKNHNLRMMYGNGLRPQIWNEFVTRFNIPKVAEFYGATEGNANIANIDNKTGAIGFVSRLVPSIYPISIIRVDENGNPVRNAEGLCQRCKPGEPGVFIGKIIPNNPARAFLGYINEKESEKKIVRDVFSKGDSAFLSGDILVSDEFGYLYFKDRTGDTFRWKGENVSTSEVEGVISNAAAYRDCVVYGVEINGTEGRAGMAAILDPTNSLDLETVAQQTKKNLPSYARPLFIRALNQVEMTGTYKLKKLDLQDEGYNPNKITDKLFYLASDSKYQPLTADVYQQIISGQIRF